MTIIVQDLNNVLIDGVNAGAVFDIAANRSDVAKPDLQRAVLAWDTANLTAAAADKAAALVTAKTASDAAQAAAVLAVQTTLGELLDETVAKISDMAPDATAAQLATELAPIITKARGYTVAAQLAAAQTAAAAAQAALAASQAQIAQLQAVVAPAA